MNRKRANNKSEAAEATKELSYIIKYLYEYFEMLSRWTPVFTSKEFLIVLALRDNKTCRIGELVQNTGFSFSTVSWLVESLVKKKVIVRRRNSSDRRVVMVKLAEKGQEAIDEYDRIFVDIADKFYGALTAEERVDFLKISRKVISTFSERSNEQNTKSGTKG